MSLFINESIHYFNKSAPLEKPEEEFFASSAVHEAALEVLSSEEYRETLRKVQNDGLSLKDAPEALRSNFEIVQAAIGENRWALQYASPAILQNFSGKAKLKYSDGRVYRGMFKNGEPHGKGSVRLQDGSKYLGTFKHGEPSGKGAFYFSNGSKYEGTVFQGKMDGWGYLRTANGSEYEGAFVKGEKHGFGDFYIDEGSEYHGFFANGKMDGKGELIYSTDTKCIATFSKGKPHGHGKITFSNGSYLEGFFIDGILEGEGKFVSVEPSITLSGTFRHNIFIFDANLGNSLFLLELFSLNSPGGAPCGFSLPIFCQYFRKKGYTEISQSLQEAYDLLLLSKEEVEVKAMLLYQELLKNPDFSKLFYYGCSSHVVGLSLSRKEDDEDSVLEINFFNAGEGLRHYHERDEKTKKFQTRACIRVPLESFSGQNFADIICAIHNYRTIFDAYDAISGLDYAEWIEIENPIYQSPQKEGNCELAWIFAYLRNTMEEKEYKKMRAELFFDVRAAALENSESELFLEKYKDRIEAKCERKAARTPLERYTYLT